MRPRAEVWVGGGIAAVGVLLQPAIGLAASIGWRLSLNQARAAFGLTLLGIVLGLVMVAHGFGAFGLIARIWRNRNLEQSYPVAMVSTYEFGKLDQRLPAPAVRQRRQLRQDGIRIEPVRQTDRLRLLVTNTGPTAAFEAQILDIQKPDGRPQFPWTLPWESGESRMQVLQEQGRFLELIRFDRAASQSMWNGHATGGPFVFPDASGTPHAAYCGSLIASNSEEMRVVRVCVHLAIFRVDPAARLDVTARFGFFEGDDSVIVGPSTCASAGEDAIRSARRARYERIKAIKESVREELVTPRFKRLELRAGEQDQIVDFLFDLGVGSVSSGTRLAVGLIQLDNGSAENRLRPENMFQAATEGVVLDLAADGNDRTLRLIQNTLQEDLMPIVCSLPWQQRLAGAIRLSFVSEGN